MEEPFTKSPQILAIQKQSAPSIRSVRSGRELVEDQEIKTIFVPETVYTFCTSEDHTVTACLANSTVDSPVRMIAEHLFGLGYGSFGLFTGEQAVTPPVAKEQPLKGMRAWLKRLRSRKTRVKEEESQTEAEDSDCDDDVHWRGIRMLGAAELAEVRKCGQWRGANPSDLFLSIYGQALLTLDKNVLNGLVSPPLMGASGVTPLTIVSHSSDIVQHYADLILNAEREIFFTTNIWEASESSRQVANAIRELSRRVVERGGDKIVIKLMYDRGALPGGAHQIVDPKVYTSEAVGLPAPDEIPGVLLEVQNYHVHPVGSFHQKSVVVDRKVALLSSNNVQNKDDVGLMVQLEGPVVQSIYDSALLSWWTTLNPRPPLLYQTPQYPDTLDRSAFQFGAEHTAIHGKGDLQATAERTVQLLATDSSSKSDDAVTDFTPIVVHKSHDPFPIALVNRTPRGRRGQGDSFVPQNQAWMAAFKFAEHNVFLQTPTFSAKPVVSAALDAVRRGVLVEIYADLGFNEQGELSPDGLANQAVAAYMYQQLGEEQREKLRICWYVAKGQRSPRASHTCHIKVMIIDGKIAVQGNGRQDMSSWYHAQEINILLESEQVCAEWRAALDSNQNTGLYGRVGYDGVWRDAGGQSLPIPEPTPTLSVNGNAELGIRRLNTGTSATSSPVRTPPITA